MSTTSHLNADSINASNSKIKSTLKKGVNFVKTHKKTTIAVVLVTGLVAANVALEKKGSLTLTPASIDIDAPSLEVSDSSN